MTAKNDDARLRLFQENKSVDALIAILKYYLERDIKVCYHPSKPFIKPDFRCIEAVNCY